MHIGIQQGIYKDEGLDVSEELSAGGAAMVPALVSGDLDVAAGNWVPFLQAVAQGIQLRAVSKAGSYVTKGIHGLFVLKDSDIQSAKDLTGKTLAVNTLGNMGELAYDEYMADANVDPTSANITELGFGDMAAALEQGNIDVAWQPGPFYDTALHNPKFRLLVDFTDIPAMKNLPNVGFVSMADWAEQNPNTVKALSTSISKASDYVNQNPDAVRKMNMEISHFTQEQADNMTIEEHDPDVPQADVQRLVDLMVKWKLLDKPVDLNQIFSLVS